MSKKMTASEYLRTLQSQAFHKLPIVDINPALREQRIKNYGHVPEYREVYFKKHTMESRDKYFHDTCVAPLLDQLPVSISGPLRDVCVGFLPSDELNAWAIRAPNGEYIVVVNTKTANVLGYFIQMIQAVNDLQRDVQRATELFNTGISYICASVKESAEGTFPCLPDIEQSAMEYGLKLVAINLWFIIAHEFAHIHLGHVSSFSPISLSQSYRPVNVQKYNRSQIEEFEADACAFGWIIAISEHGSDFIAKYIHENPVGCLELFTLFHYIECGLGIEASPASSHPSAGDRIWQLYKRFSVSLPIDAQLRLESWSDWMQARKDG